MGSRLPKAWQAARGSRGCLHSVGWEDGGLGAVQDAHCAWEAGTPAGAPALPPTLAALSRVQLCVTAWTAALQAPLSMGLSAQEYCSGSPFAPAGALPTPGIEPVSPALQEDSLQLSH